MAERTYNAGRVVGWSAYEQFLKEHPDVDPSTITEQIYTSAITFGVTRIVNLPLTDWSGTNILTKTVAVPGAVWGVVPIASIYYDGLDALADTDSAGTAKEYALAAASSIFACYCSDAQGHKLDSSVSSSGYITFCAHPKVLSTDLAVLPLIIRGLGLQGLADNQAYFGPEGLVNATQDLMNVETPTYVDITQIFATKWWDPDTQTYTDGQEYLPFRLGYGDKSAYPVLQPWYSTTVTSPQESNFDGFYRAVMRLYRSPLNTVSKFDLLVLGYLKEDVTLTPTSGDFCGRGFWWRGQVPDPVYNHIHSRYPDVDRGQMTAICNTAGDVSGAFQPSTPRIVLWDTVPETPSVNWGNVGYLKNKTFSVTNITAAWQLNFTIKGQGLDGTNNDRLFGIDTSCSEGAVTTAIGLSTYAGNTQTTPSYTWQATTTVDPLIADFDPSHASFYQVFSGTYLSV